jgi:hypothetical protein
MQSNIISELLNSGSLALPTKTPRGVVISPPTATSTYVGGTTHMDTYDPNEIVKVLDVAIDELIQPDVPTPIPSVPVDRFNTVVSELQQTRNELSDALTDVAEKSDKINALELEVEQLRQSIDRERVDKSIFQNLLVESNQSVASTTTSLQNAIQKATYESTRRVAYEAISESLTQEIQALRRQVLSVVASSGGKFGNNFAAQVNSRFNFDIPSKYDMVFIINSKQGIVLWTSGPFIDVVLTSDDPTLLIYLDKPKIRSDLSTFPIRVDQVTLDQSPTLSEKVRLIRYRVNLNSELFNAINTLNEIDGVNSFTSYSTTVQFTGTQSNMPTIDTPIDTSVELTIGIIDAT